MLWLKTNPWPNWTRFKGIEVRGEYDGILIWQCCDCKHRWPRFSQEQWETVYNKAVRIINDWNKESNEEDH